MADTRTITMQVNGRQRTGSTETRTHLADFLREELGLTGTHLGCEHGVCGACTVLVDDDAVRSCLILAVQADGRDVTTIEGLADGSELSVVQEAFRELHGLQCGFCTPGMIMSLTAFLKKEPEPDERSIREAISGNICRCTGYQAIVRAGLKSAEVLRGQ